MWERFSYYGMRALLVFYMIKGFLGYNDHRAYAVYGAYTALVYAAPFIGGMFADRLLGARRAVILGGLLMAAGHVLMMAKDETVFFMALALLICGNGFFKPSISTMVGGLYPQGSPKKDAGFTIFYMGINLGAAMSPVICGYVGETYGWHYGFGLATIGMLIGVAVFAAPTRLTQLLIFVGAIGTAIAMPFFQDTTLQLAVRLLLSAALAASGIIAVVALGRGGLPENAGAPRDPAGLKRKLRGILRADVALYLGVLIVVPFIALVVQRDIMARLVLLVTGAWALGFIAYEALFRSNKIERERLCVALVLMFFSVLFWAFFEQAGSSVNNFTDRNIDRVFEDRQITEADVGTTLKLRVPPRAGEVGLAGLPLLSQEQLGKGCGPELLSMVDSAKARQKARKAKENEVPETTDGDSASKSNDRTIWLSVSPSPPNILENDASNLVFTFSIAEVTEDPLPLSFKVSGTAM
ncbi:MAG: peptide MFS transporter, partial [Thermoguttaceae bacterium]